MVYDGGVAGPGNITSQTGVGTYAYPAAGQPQPHAVTSLTGTFNGIVNPTFSYDLNGNMSSRAGSSISWFSNNYPATISASDTTGSEEVQFSYGPDRQRWEQVYTGPSGTETTYYIGGLIDLVFIGGIANYRHYIYAGNEPVAVYNRTAAGNAMSYMLEDHQGGISAIASSAGTVNGTTGINESFSAFGARRSPTTWSGAPSTPDLSTIASLSRQGYTFQTWLGQSMGLNHMNGRVEDAILGRFLSPDPHIPDPTNAQSYNRYSYVNNNPLTMVDPTGFINKYPSFGGGGGGFIWGATDVSFDSGLTFNAVNGDGGSPFWGQSTTTGIGGTTGTGGGGGASGSWDDDSDLTEITVTAQKYSVDENTGQVVALSVAAVGAVATVGAMANSVAVGSQAATRAMWVGEDGLAAAQASGAQTMTLSAGAQAAFDAGNMGPMIAESTSWAQGAVGENALVFVGTPANGAGLLETTFFGAELPQAITNLSTGALRLLTIIS
jgi:RHS repeat-associated protein